MISKVLFQLNLCEKAYSRFLIHVNNRISFISGHGIPTLKYLFCEHILKNRSHNFNFKLKIIPVQGMPERLSNSQILLRLFIEFTNFKDLLKPFLFIGV